LVLFLKRTTLINYLKPRRATVFGSLIKKNNIIIYLNSRRATVFGSFFKKNNTYQRVVTSRRNKKFQVNKVNPVFSWVSTTAGSLLIKHTLLKLSERALGFGDFVIRLVVFFFFQKKKQKAFVLFQEGWFRYTLILAKPTQGG
jgi:hypothetical protein